MEHGSSARAGANVASRVNASSNNGRPHLGNPAESSESLEARLARRGAVADLLEAVHRRCGWGELHGDAEKLTLRLDYSRYVDPPQPIDAAHKLFLDGRAFRKEAASRYAELGEPFAEMCTHVANLNLAAALTLALEQMSRQEIPPAESPTVPAGFRDRRALVALADVMAAHLQGHPVAVITPVQTDLIDFKFLTAGGLARRLGKRTEVIRALRLSRRALTAALRAQGLEDSWNVHTCVDLYLAAGLPEDAARVADATGATSLAFQILHGLRRDGRLDAAPPAGYATLFRSLLGRSVSSAAAPTGLDLTEARALLLGSSTLDDAAVPRAEAAQFYLRAIRRVFRRMPIFVPEDFILEAPGVVIIF